MRWKVATSTVTGKAHAQRGEAGQDCHRAGTVRIAGSEFFIGLVSDGAGCTTDGGRGAEIACLTIYGRIIVSLEESFDSGKGDGYASEEPFIAEQVIRDWITAAREAIEADATGTGKPIRNYACTFLGVVSGNGCTVFFQIGDGAIVTNERGEYRTIFWPDQGEYANTTFFVTDDEYLDRLRILRLESFPEEIAIFTDGLQNLVLSFVQKKAHAGFFRPLFEALQKTPENSLSGFVAQLHTFLSRDEINARSDDDRTLLLAVRMEG